MKRAADYVWIGDSSDAAEGDLGEVTVLFNCAHDLEARRGWRHKLEYVQVGLVDGPGNSLADYCAAMLKLCSYVQAKRRVLVYDHDGSSRAAAVIIMAMHALHRRGWDYWLAVLREKLEQPELTPHPAHRRAFDRLNWRLVSSLLEAEL